MRINLLYYRILINLFKLSVVVINLNIECESNYL